MIKDLNISPETIKLVEENIGEKLNIGLSNDFFGNDTNGTNKRKIQAGLLT